METLVESWLNSRDSFIILTFFYITLQNIIFPQSKPLAFFIVHSDNVFE